MRGIAAKHFFSKSGILIQTTGLLIGIILFWIIQSIENEANKHEFKHLLDRDVSLIQRELDLNLEVLLSIKHFFASSEHVSRTDFKQFVANSLDKYPSIQALEWIPKVWDSKRTLYEEMASIDLKSEYKIKEKNSKNEWVSAQQRAYYYPVYYVEPLESNESVVGYDIASNEVRLRALLNAEKNRTISVSPKIKLLQGKDGFLVFNPVWLKQNSNELMGFVLGVYNFEGIIDDALRIDTNNKSKLDIWLVDSTNSRNEPTVLFANTKESIDFRRFDSRKLNIQGREWNVFARPNATFNQSNLKYLPHITFIIILLISMLLNYIIALRVSREDSLKKLVAQKVQTIEEGNRRYASLLQMFDKRVIASKTDIKGVITYVTQAFCKISGYSADELLGQNHSIVRHEDMPKSLYEKMWQTIQSGNVFTGEIKNKKKDGSAYWVFVQIEPEFDDKGNIVSYFAIREDITAKKQLEEFNQNLEEKIERAVEQNTQKDKLLVEQSKLAAMGEMIGAIAHQWRQPLNTLAMKIQFLEDDYEDEILDEKYLKEFSGESMKLIHFMSKTIDDFRNFFILDKEKVSFDVMTKIQDTTSILEAQLSTNKISLMITGESFSILGFPNEFQQVILNIVNNAKDAMIDNRTQNGMILISINASQNEVVIKDNAGGIPEDVLPRIFEPYFTTKEQGKGTGLGLYMSKMIIEDNMHGKLEVFNESGGAKFIIRLGENHEQ